MNSVIWQRATGTGTANTYLEAFYLLFPLILHILAKILTLFSLCYCEYENFRHVWERILQLIMTATYFSI